MLVEYIKDIIDSDKWDVKLTDGKYIVKQIIDCKENSLMPAVRETAICLAVSGIKKKLKRYLPEDVIYEVKYELINVPKPKIQLYTSGGEDMLKYADTYTNLHRTYGTHSNNYLIDNSDINTDITNVGIV
jgi:hypothetical protein